MATVNNSRRLFLGTAGAVVATSALVGVCNAQGKKQRPAAQVAKNPVQGGAAAKHPLDNVLPLAEEGLTRIREKLDDYDCTIVKRERISGKLGNPETMYAKIRNRKIENGRVVVPFAVYLRFEKPENIKGREVLYVEGKNNGKMWVREAGSIGKLAGVLSLDPKGSLAMRGQLYPITEIGIENLLVKLLEKGNRDRARGECEIEVDEDMQINKRKCSLIKVIHPERRPYFDFHMADIFIDQELELPCRYAAYSWPTKEDEEPPVLEEYTYLKLRPNPGFTDIDFSPENPDYKLK
jgi:hypothetical protein